MTCLYSKNNIWLLVFVDDVIITGDTKEVEETVENLQKVFKSKDLGDIKEFLGMEIERNKGSMKITQSKYTKENLADVLTKPLAYERFNELIQKIIN